MRNKMKWILFAAFGLAMLGGCAELPPCGAPGGGSGCYSFESASDTADTGTGKRQLCSEARGRAQDRCKEFGLAARLDQERGCVCEKRILTGVDAQGRAERPEYHMLCSVEYKCGRDD